MRYDKIVDFDPYNDGCEIMAGRPDRQAPELPDRRRMALLQPCVNLDQME